MAVYNGMPYLTEAIDSVLNQTLKDWELLIIDDGSKDDSPAYLDSLTDPRIRVVHQANRGLAGALNRGLELCETEYLGRLDADDVALPTRFEKQLKFLQSHPEVGLVGSQFTWLYNGRAGGGGPFPLEHRAIYERLMNGRAGCCHSAMMCRTQLLREAGGYWDVGLSEDWDMFLRMGERAELANLDEVLLQVRMVDTSLQSQQMANVKSRIAYACELARRRQQGLPHIEYDEFKELTRDDSWWKRLKHNLEVYAHSQYRKAQAEILGDRVMLGRARVAWAAACAPQMTWDRIWRVARRRLRGPQTNGYTQHTETPTGVTT
jgi:glycosyltransferase involved in cell wall biosynthesis